MNESVISLLQRARNLLSEPARWTKRIWARDMRGRSADVRGDSAVCFCPDGALFRLSPGDGTIVDARLALERATPSGFRSFISYNDDPATTHADVLRLFDDAIEAERGR